MFSIFFELSYLLEQVRQQGVVRPDTGAQFPATRLRTYTAGRLLSGGCYARVYLFSCGVVRFQRMTFQLIYDAGYAFLSSVSASTLFDRVSETRLSLRS